MIKLDTFTRAYIEAALWSSMDDEGEPLIRWYGAEDIDANTLPQMQADCNSFLEQAGELLSVADHEQAGFDFWLTRNRHGAGFWDGGWPDEIGKELTKLAHSFGTHDLYIGNDGKIH